MHDIKKLRASTSSCLVLLLQELVRIARQALVCWRPPRSLLESLLVKGSYRSSTHCGPLSLAFFLFPSAFYESQESCPYACHYTSATSRSKFGFFSAWSFKATPQAVAIRSSIVSECPVYSASSRRAITDCVVPTFLASSA